MGNALIKIYFYFFEICYVSFFFVKFRNYLRVGCGALYDVAGVVSEWFFLLGYVFYKRNRFGCSS